MKSKYYDDDKNHSGRGNVTWNEKVCAYTPVVYMVILLTVIIIISDMFYHPPSFGAAKPTSRENDPSKPINLRAAVDNPLVTVPVIPELPNIKTELITSIERLIVIPGGGGGDSGYPEWTKRRVVEASKYYLTILSQEQREKTFFLLLSAGSLNTPNAQSSDRRIVFENQHMISHLKELGIAEERIHGDIFSWDTVTNGLSLRLFLEGLCSYHPSPLLRKTISIEVFISDFHLKRVESALTWALSVEPSLLASPSSTTLQAKITMHSVSSEGIAALTAEALEERSKHEEKGVEMIQEQMKAVKTFPQYCAFLMMGGHLGIRKYLFSDYTKSTGVGW